MQPAKGLRVVIEALYLIFFISLACSFRAVSSIAIALLIIAGVIITWTRTKSFINQTIKNPFLYACLLLFLFHLIALLYTGNKHEGWLDIQAKSGLVLIPLAVCYTSYINEFSKKRLSLYYILIVIVVALYCLGYGIWNYSQSGDFSFLFYHLLVLPIKSHAIYFSVLVFIALLFLIEIQGRNSFVLNRYLHGSFIIFLSIFLFLLSSKIVICFYLLYLVVYLIGLIKTKSSHRFLIISALAIFIIANIIVLTTTNPVSNRFSDIMKGDLHVVTMDRFHPGMYFNGVQFRLLQWKFTSGILSENHCWWTGVGPGDAQHFLDQKYISSNMYVGDPSKSDHGFLGYNTHNQFLETILQTGIFGLLALLFVCFTLLRMAWQKRKRETSFIIGLLLAWLLTESVLERQYGIIIFTFFPFFIWLDEK
jgi:O-antigen ligase